jgi:hypothetical protein
MCLILLLLLFLERNIEIEKVIFNYKINWVSIRVSKKST